MNVTDFTEEQRSALLDLLVLAMYLDANLASAEEARVQQLLTAMGLKTPFDRDREFDAAVTRVRQASEAADTACACAGRLTECFVSREQRQQVYDVLNDLISSDGRVSALEEKFLGFVREKFEM